MTAAIWGILAGVGALLLGAFGIFSRKSGIDSEKAAVATETALQQKKMAEAAASAPRTTEDTRAAMRQGKF